jgi:uncharacterized repeat protein (TIGR02543 family)
MSTKPRLQRWNTTAALFLAIASVAFALDTDSDGLDDSVETNTGVHVSPTDTGTDPNTADTDGDGVPDGLEVKEKTSPVDVAKFNTFSQGLHAYYSFDGDANDKSGFGRNGTVQGTYEMLSNDIRLIGDQSTYYSGGGWFSPHSTGMSNDSFTLSVWTRSLNSGGSLEESHLLNLGSWDEFGKNVLAFSYNPEAHSFVTYAGINGTSTTTSPMTETINHFAITKDDQTVRFFLNGAMVRELTFAANASFLPTDYLSLNHHWWSGGSSSASRATGTYSNFRLYQRSLTAEELGQLHQQEKPPAPRFQIIEGAFTWHDAKADAESRGGRLAVLDTQEKIDEANAFLNEMNHSANCWIGLTDEVSEGQWKWITGNDLSASNWNSDTGEPNNGYGYGENYAMMAAEWQWRWNDGQSVAGADISYLLELPTPVLTTQPGVGGNINVVRGFDSPTATITAIPNSGYLFSGWTGDASGTDNPLTLTMDSAKTVGATFSQDLSDTDGDGLNAFEELAIYGTDPTKADTDGDGLSDGFEVIRYSVVLETLTWAQAKAHAEAAGGSLATFPNEITWNRARLAIGPDALLDINGLWIGATDSAEEGVWRWITGEPFDFTQWATGEPNDRNNSDYAAVAGDLGGEEGRWYDYRATTTHDGYVLALGYGTDPLVADTDGDGLSDGEEHTRGTNPFSNDTDSDGLQDQVEVRQTGTNPLLADTDGDSVPDGAEDSDGDGLTNADEVTRGTNPGAVDTDGDSLSDSVEVLKTLTDPLDPDSDDDGFSDFDSDPDGDGLSHGEEIARGTDPNQADTDSDGLPDGVEARQTSTNPLLADSNSNGTPDGMEDSDGDLLTNLEELEIGTHPSLADTDSDGLSDWQELGRDRFELVMGSFTHAQAAAAAAARGGYLATITSAEEQQAAMAAIDPALLEDLTGFWIGASDAAVEGEWRWGTGESFAHANWGTARPSAVEGNTLDFTEISGGGGAEIGNWYDRTATTVRTAYLLEKSFVTNPLAADTDGDGLDDAVEITHSTMPHVADTDGDGSWDGAEIEFGSAPRDGGIMPELKANIRLSATPMPGVEIRFPSMPGKSYIVHASTDLVEWQALGSLVGTGGVMSHNEPRGTHLSRFFKVEASDVLPDMALIPSSSFTMGDSLDGGSNAPPVTVIVSAFYMAKYEVTKTLWDGVRAWALDHGYFDLWDAGGKGPDHPAHSINWYEVVKWCNARSEMEGLTPCYTVDGSQIYKTGQRDDVVCNWNANGYRLPTEAEWEKAARGGLSGMRFPWGDAPISHDLANFWNEGWEPYQTGSTGPHPSYADYFFPFSSPVGSFAPNGYGLYDMAGNMWEWCWDWYESYPSTSQTDPRGSASGTSRVNRGGGWGNFADYCRVAYRDDIGDPSLTDESIGFRVARSSARTTKLQGDSSKF